MKLFLKQYPAPPEEIEGVSVSLQQLGIKGGTYFEPEEVTILYQTESKFNLSISNLCYTSINDCFLLFDDASLWKEKAVPKLSDESSIKTKCSISTSLLTDPSSNTEEPVCESVESSASFLTVEKVSQC